MRQLSIHPTTAVHHTKQLSIHPTTTEHLNRAMECTTKVYIPRIPHQTTSTDLTELFSNLFPQQKILDVNIKTRYEGKYAFVKFQKEVLLPIERRVFCPWTDDAWLVFKAATSRKRSTAQSNSTKANDKNPTSRRQGEKSTATSKIEANSDINNKRNNSKNSANNRILIENLPRQRSNLEEDITSFFRMFLPKVQIKKIQIERRSPSDLIALVEFDAGVTEVFANSDSSIVPCSWGTDRKLRLKMPNQLAKEAPLHNNDKNSPKTGNFEDTSKTANKLTEEGGKSAEYTNSYYSSLSKDSTGSSTSRANDGQSNKIYIRNLPRNTTRDQVARLFAETYPDTSLRGIFISSNTGSRKFGFAFLSSKDDMGTVLGDSIAMKVPCPWAKEVTLELEAGKKHAKNYDNGSNDVAVEVQNEKEPQINSGHVTNKPIEEDHSSSATGAAQKPATAEASPATKRSKESSSSVSDISAELAATKLLLEKATLESSTIRADLELARKQLIPGTKAIEEVKLLQNELKVTKTKLKEVKVLQNELQLTKTKLKESQSEISLLNEDLYTTKKDLESLRSDLAISELMNSANSTTFDSLHSRGGFALNLGIEAALSSGSGMGIDDQNREDVNGSSPENSTTMSAETEVLDAEDERRSAEKCEVELVLLRSLFTPEELWLSTSPTSNLPTIHRRLWFPIGSGSQPVAVELILTVPVGYSVYSSAVLGVEASLDDSNIDVDGEVRACIIGSLPRLIAACRREAKTHAGEDAIFFVMQSADAWLINDWKDIFKNEMEHVK